MFTLYLPLKYSGPTIAPRTSPPSQFGSAPAMPVVTQERVTEQLPDDRLSLEPGDTILLIVEDDPHYARVLVDLARDKNFKVLVAARGSEEHSTSPSNISQARSRSTSSCPTCSAGRC